MWRSEREVIALAIDKGAQTFHVKCCENAWQKFSLPDGLAQKAGFPQERICEVHGSWFDPSNPVVKYSGSLKGHECEWMERETEEADLVLVMGTSLSGVSADQLVSEVGRKRLVAKEAAEGAAAKAACVLVIQPPRSLVRSAA